MRCHLHLQPACFSVFRAVQRTASWALLAMMLVGIAPLAAQAAPVYGANFYDVVNGTFAAAFNPTLSGGDFNGRAISELSASEIAGIRDSNTSNLILLGPSGLAFYDVVTGAFNAAFNPTLSGGDFNGQSINSLSTNSIAGMRDSANSNVALLGPSGITFYNVVNGAFGNSFNPILSGGDFNGQSVSSLSISSIAGMRDAGGANLVLLGPSGITFYDVVTGAFAYSFNPTLSGGHFDGHSASSLAINDIAGIRDAVGSNLVLFAPVPEPSTWALALTGLAACTLAGIRRRRRQFAA